MPQLTTSPLRPITQVVEDTMRSMTQGIETTVKASFDVQQALVESTGSLLRAGFAANKIAVDQWLALSTQQQQPSLIRALEKSVQTWAGMAERTVAAAQHTTEQAATRAQLRAAEAFEPDQFHALEAERADAETPRRARYGAAPDSAVEIGGVKPAAASGNQKPTSLTTPAPGADEQRLELREEELLVRKQSVQTGEVAIHTNVVAEQRTLEVPVTHEEVTIERHAVDRRPSERAIGEDETISVPVHEEQVTAEKQAVVYEEVKVGTHAVQETQRVSGTVQREKAVITKEGDVDLEDQPKPRRSAGR